MSRLVERASDEMSDAPVGPPRARSAAPGDSRSGGDIEAGTRMAPNDACASFGARSLAEDGGFEPRMSAVRVTRVVLGGGWGIRTPEGFHPTRFPSVRHRPLGESS